MAGAGIRTKPCNGGCPFLENPALDAREARPLWRIGRRPLLQLIPHADPGADAFDVWAIPGRKSLVLGEDGLWLHGGSGQRLLALSPDIAVGEPFGYALPAGIDDKQGHVALERAMTLLQRSPPATPAALARPPRSALVHMRALQALDGTRAGASQREIAIELFGDEDVAARWSPDGELRAQVRYLIQRGTVLMEGEYRNLLD